MQSNAHYNHALDLEKRGASSEEILAALEAGDAEDCAEAQYALATLYLHGKYVPRDPEKTLTYLRRAARQMHPAALFDLAVSLETGDIVKRNLKEAFRCYLLSMIAGDRDSIYEVARCLYYGIGTKRNKSMHDSLMIADDYFKRSAAGTETPI